MHSLNCSVISSLILLTLLTISAVELNVSLVGSALFELMLVVSLSIWASLVIEFEFASLRSV